MASENSLYNYSRLSEYMERDKRGVDFAPPEVMNYAKLNPAEPRSGTVREKKSAPQSGRPRPAPPPLPGAPGGTGGFGGRGSKFIDFGACEGTERREPAASA
eukprot:13666868-Heterocapsa_arctica.AAC.1